MEKVQAEIKALQDLLKESITSKMANGIKKQMNAQKPVVNGSAPAKDDSGGASPQSKPSFGIKRPSTALTARNPISEAPAPKGVI